MRLRPVRPLVLVALAAATAFAQESPPDDASRGFESPPDARKFVLEFPTQRILRDSDRRGGAAPASEAEERVAATPRMPVRPGLVAWRADRAAALEAAAASGRPVLVFQMMGDLDDELC